MRERRGRAEPAAAARTVNCVGTAIGVAAGVVGLIKFGWHVVGPACLLLTFLLTLGRALQTGRIIWFLGWRTTTRTQQPVTFAIGCLLFVVAAALSGVGLVQELQKAQLL